VGRPYSLCEKSQTGCRTTVEPIGYDPETAKKLMAEAGYENGFDLTITSPLAPGAKMAELISGHLQAINIRASIDQITFPAFRDREGDGKFQLTLAAYGASPETDVGNTVEYQFGPGDRNYHNNPKFLELVEASKHEMDPEKRAEITQQ